MNERTKQIEARKLKVGDRMISEGAREPLPVRAIAMCPDGALRIFHRLGDARMTGSVRVTVAA